MILVAARAWPLLEPIDAAAGDDYRALKLPQDPYAIYKTMRADPRLASVPNKDLVFYIYRYLELAQKTNKVESVKQHHADPDDPQQD